MLLIRILVYIKILDKFNGDGYAFSIFFVVSLTSLSACHSYIILKFEIKRQCSNFNSLKCIKKKVLLNLVLNLKI